MARLAARDQFQLPLHVRDVLRPEDFRERILHVAPVGACQSVGIAQGVFQQSPLARQNNRVFTGQCVVWREEIHEVRGPGRRRLER